MSLPLSLSQETAPRGVVAELNTNRAASKVAADQDDNYPCIVLLLLCGLPAAGKSSVARLLPLEMEDKRQSLNVRTDWLLLCQYASWTCSLTLSNCVAFMLVSSPCVIHSLSFDGIYSELQQQRGAHSTSTSPTATATSRPTVKQSIVKEAHPPATKVFDPKLWRESRIIAAELTEAIIRHILTSSSSRSAAKQQQKKECHILLLDDNFYLRSMRHRYYQLAREHRIRFLQLYLDIPVEVAIERNQQRMAAHGDQARVEFSRINEDDRILLQKILLNPASTTICPHLDSISSLSPSSSSNSSPSSSSSSSSSSVLEEMEVNESTIRKMSAAFELPPFDLTQDDHSRNWEKFSYLVRTDATKTAKSIIPWSVIGEAISSDKFVPPLLADPIVEAERLAKARQETHASLLHNLDLQSRRCIQQKMQSMLAIPNIEKSAVQAAAAKWNQMRKTLLADAKKVGSTVHTKIQAAAAAAQQSAPSNHSSLPSESESPLLSEILMDFEGNLSI